MSANLNFYPDSPADYEVPTTRLKSPGAPDYQSRNLPPDVKRESSDPPPSLSNPKTTQPLDPTQAMYSLAMYSFLPGAVVKAAPLIAGVGNLAIKTWEKETKAQPLTPRSPDAQPTNGANKATQPNDPNNKVLNTNDRSVLDRHQAVNGLLEGQIDNSRSVFIEHKNADGTKSLAYKYDDGKGGDVRSGKIELDDKGKFKGDWQAIEKGSNLEKDLDTAHKTKMAEIDRYAKGGDRSIGVEKYRAAKSLEGDIQTLKGLNGGRVEPRHDQLVKEMEKLNALETRLNDKANDPREVKKDFDTLLKSSPLLTLTLANTRATNLQTTAPEQFGDLTKRLVDVKPPLNRNDFVDKAVEEERNKKQALTTDDEKKQLETDLKTFESKVKQLSTDSPLRLASQNLIDSYNTKGSTETQGKYMQQQLAYLNSKLGAASGTDKAEKVPVPPLPEPTAGEKRLANIQGYLDDKKTGLTTQEHIDARRELGRDLNKETGQLMSKFSPTSITGNQVVMKSDVEKDDEKLRVSIDPNGKISGVEKFNPETNKWAPYIAASAKPAEPTNPPDLPTSPEPERVPPKLERVTANATTKTIAVQEETTTNGIPTLKAGNDLFMKNNGLYIKVGGGNKPDEYFYDKDSKTLTKVQPSTYVSDSKKGNYRIAETEDGSQQFASKNGEDYQAMDRVIDGKLAGAYTLDNQTYFAKYTTVGGGKEYDFVSETQNGTVINGSTSRTNASFSFEDRKYYMENYGAIQNGAYPKSSDSKLLAIEANSLQEAVSGKVPQEVRDYQNLYKDMVSYQRGDKKIDKITIKNLNQDFALITVQGKLDVDRLRAMRTYLDAMQKNNN